MELVLYQIAENKKERALSDVWKKREIKIGIDLPETGKLEDYLDKSPEKEISQFLSNWKFGNYGNIASQLIHSSKDSFSPKKEGGKIRQIFYGFQLTSFIIKEVIDVAPAITELVILVDYKQKELSFIKEVKLRLLYTDDNYSPIVRGVERGSWKIIENFGFLNEN